MSIAAFAISEKTLSWAWRNQCLDRNLLFTTDGLPLQVVFPGVLNTESGPDYRGAIAALADGRLLEGDVELHLRSSDWQAHGHHLNPAYDRVALHVVLHNDLPCPVTRCDGRSVATLEIGPALAGLPDELKLWESLDQPSEASCRNAVARLGEEATSAALDAAGERRFEARVDRFSTELDESLPDQVLFAGLMEGLGYSRNKAPFRRLAGLMPLSALEGCIQGKAQPERRPILEALLLGAAGLLPEDGPLPGIWRSFGDPAGMEKGEWQLFRVRPENHPARRIAAAASLIERWLNTGLLHGLLSLIPAGWQAMERGLMVAAPASGGQGRPALLGRPRAREIAVNVILPFARAWARRGKDMELSRQAGRLYRTWPGMEDNGITRQMTRKLTGKDTHPSWRTACRQQGLIHLQRTYCDRFRCSRCPLVAGIRAPAGEVLLPVAID